MTSKLALKIKLKNGPFCPLLCFYAETIQKQYLDLPNLLLGKMKIISNAPV
jgi:hypothetical protein